METTEKRHRVVAPQQPAASTVDSAGSSHRPGRMRNPMGNPRPSAGALLPIAVAAAILLWTVLAIAVDNIPLALFSPQGQTGVEAASALARFFGAVVLLLFSEERLGFRLRWVAAGFIVLGLGGLLFGFFWPLTGAEFSPNEAMYASLVVWSTAGTLFVIGLVPFIRAPFSR
ncbi:hypothetical protein BH23CHL1_BH23CHL1_27140 [soil metagenome]